MVQIKQKKITIDTMFLIYFLDRESQYFNIVKSAMQLTSQVWASLLAHCETATGFYINNDFKNLDTITMLSEIVKNFSFVPFTMEISLEAARLRARYPSLKTPDSIHLATGIFKKADYFITDDKRLKKITEIPILTIDEIGLDGRRT